MRIFIFFVFFILVNTAITSALCEEEQIDINSASVEELDNLYGIGPAKAQGIINSRPFGSVEDLINVNGIGEVTLNKIKEQNLACTSEDIEDLSEDRSNVSIQEVEIKSDFEEIEISKTLNVIDLTPKSIKSEDNREINGSKVAFYGFIIFSVFISILFLFRKKRKNEFD